MKRYEDAAQYEAALAAWVHEMGGKAEPDQRGYGMSGSKQASTHPNASIPLHITHSMHLAGYGHRKADGRSHEGR